MKNDIPHDRLWLSNISHHHSADISSQIWSARIYGFNGACEVGIKQTHVPRITQKQTLGIRLELSEMSQVHFLICRLTAYFSIARK
jgi:hypothetical protein